MRPRARRNNQRGITWSAGASRELNSHPMTGSDFPGMGVNYRRDGATGLVRAGPQQRREQSREREKAARIAPEELHECMKGKYDAVVVRVTT